MFRASPAYSDISDDGDPTQTVPEKEIDKDSGLTSSLAYKTGTAAQFSTQFHRFGGDKFAHQNRFDIYSLRPVNCNQLFREEKKDAKGDDKDTKIIKNEVGSTSCEQYLINTYKEWPDPTATWWHWCPAKSKGTWSSRVKETDSDNSPNVQHRAQ